MIVVGHRAVGQINGGLFTLKPIQSLDVIVASVK